MGTLLEKTASTAVQTYKVCERQDGTRHRQPGDVGVKCHATAVDSNHEDDETSAMWNWKTTADECQAWRDLGSG